MDIIKALRGAWVSALSAKGVQLHDQYLDDDEAPETYVVIPDQGDIIYDDKCQNSHRTSITMEIIHRDINHGGMRFCDDVAEIINDTGKENNLPIDAGFIVVSSRKISDTTIPGISDVYKIYRRIIRYEHFITEN